MDVEERVDHLAHGGTDGRRLLAHIADERERGKDGGDRFDPEHQHGGEAGVRVGSRSMQRRRGMRGRSEDRKKRISRRLSKEFDGDLDQPRWTNLLRPPLAHYMGASNATRSRPWYGADDGLLGIIFRPRSLSLTLHRRRSSDVADRDPLRLSAIAGQPRSRTARWLHRWSMMTPSARGRARARVPVGDHAFGLINQ